jgi:hypothetical protein
MQVPTSFALKLADASGKPANHELRIGKPQTAGSGRMPHKYHTLPPGLGYDPKIKVSHQMSKIQPQNGRIGYQSQPQDWHKGLVKAPEVSLSH